MSEAQAVTTETHETLSADNVRRAFLLRRGFPAGLVRERLSALWPRWREGLEDVPEADDRPGEE